ncbi:MAG: EF-P lysine aminoacylase EpmA [Pirellulaceae bacterium]
MARPNVTHWQPTADLALLRQRAEITHKIRGFFTERGFWEVETPLLSRDTVVDIHLDPLPVTLAADPRRPEVGPTYYLQTSPEFAMKRLLAAGADAIFQIGKAFRQGESGPRHNVEFTLTEWYRAGDDYAAGMQLLSDFAEHMLDRGPAKRITYRELFQENLGIDPHRCTMSELRKVAALHQIAVPASYTDDDCDGMLELLLGELLEGDLGREQPLILHDYPGTQAALATIRRDAGASVAERFELYVDGCELANGYHELLDTNSLAVRNGQNNQRRAADGRPKLPEDSQLLEAMRHGLPPSSGCALGLDRLVMLITGATEIQQVIPFPIQRA